MKQAKNVQVENVVLQNRPLSNFELLETVKKIGLKKLSWCFLERHSAKDTTKKI